jgi:hypothetical protein
MIASLPLLTQSGHRCTAARSINATEKTAGGVSRITRLRSLVAVVPPEAMNLQISGLARCADGTKCPLGRFTPTHPSSWRHQFVSAWQPHLERPAGKRWRYVFSRSPDPTQRDQSMNTSEKFLRFAAECSIDAICWLVSGFSDPLPEVTCNELRGYVGAGRPDLKEKLAGNPSYARGGECLLSLMEDQKAAYTRLLNE